MVNVDPSGLIGLDTNGYSSSSNQGSSYRPDTINDNKTGHESKDEKEQKPNVVEQAVTDAMIWTSARIACGSIQFSQQISAPVLDALRGLGFEEFVDKTETGMQDSLATIRAMENSEGNEFLTNNPINPIVDTVVANTLGKQVRNAHLAGGTHPVTGIPFTIDGFPDFSSVSIKDVIINVTGNRAKDFRAANEIAGYSRTPEDYTWHHHEDGTTMQLLPRDIHAKTGHTGSVGLREE